MVMINIQSVIYYMLCIIIYYNTIYLYYNILSYKHMTKLLIKIFGENFVDKSFICLDRILIEILFTMK